MNYSCREGLDVGSEQEYIEKVEIRNDVIVVAEEDKDMIISVDSSSLYIKSDSKLAQKIKKGHVILSGSVPAYNSGFIRRITNVIQSSDVVEFHTENARLADAFSEFNFSSELIIPDTLSYLRMSNLNIILPRKKFVLEDIVESKEVANRIKYNILVLLELENVVEVKDVDISMTLSMSMGSNVSFNPQSQRGFVDMNFSNTSISYSFKPVISIGKGINYTDKYMEICDVISQHASVCSGSSLTWAKVESPQLPLWPDPPVSGKIFGRLFFNLSALLAGEIGVEQKTTVSQFISNFGIRVGGSSLVSLVNSSNTNLMDESSTSLKLFGNAKVSGKLGLGMELGVALYDQSVLAYNTGIESYLSANVVAAGEIGGSISALKGGNASISGDITARADFKVDIYGTVSSEMGEMIGLSPQNLIGVRVNLYSNNLFNTRQNCGSYADYHVSTTACDNIVLNYHVDGGVSLNPDSVKHLDLTVYLPDGTRRDVHNMPYDVYHQLELGNSLQEGEEIEVVIYSVEESCEIVRARYVIPECENREWVPIRSKSGIFAQNLYYVQKQNLRLGGNFGEYYENIPALGELYGKLYSWEDVVRPGTSLEGKGLCPDKSVVPSLDNWRYNILAHLQAYTSGNPEGKKIVDLDLVRNSNTPYPTYKYLGANLLKEAAGWDDERDGIPNSILNIFAAGAKFQGSNNGRSPFQFRGRSTGFWTSTSVNDNDAYAVVLEGNGNDTIYVLPYTKNTKLSCRCTKFKL